MDTRAKQASSPKSAGKGGWKLMGGAAAAITVALIGFAVFGGLDSNAGDEPEALELNAGGEDAMASCIAFSTEELAVVGQIAFEGTVTNVEGPTVTMEVEHWYRGGGAPVVILNGPQGMEALIGGIPFVVDDQYLVTAQAGNVNYCGFSGPSSADYRSSFEAAFGT